MAFKKFKPLAQLSNNEPNAVIVITEMGYKIMGQEKELSTEMLAECLESIIQSLRE